jgi:hypothetical protein
MKFHQFGSSAIPPNNEMHSKIFSIRDRLEKSQPSRSANLSSALKSAASHDTSTKSAPGYIARQTNTTPQ